MRFLPSRANALFEFDEIASLAVAIEVFLPQRIARHAQGFRARRPGLRRNGAIEKRPKSATGALAWVFATMPIAVTPIGPCAARRTIPQSPTPIINDGRGQLATACVLG